MQQKKRNAYRK